MLDQGYGLMPNSVLFDKELTDKQKLLFCLISSLCAEKGYCWATNDYIGEKLDASGITISKNISTLQAKGFIVVELENRNQRKITLVKNDKGDSQKGIGGDSQKGQHNNISNNITNNNYSFQEFWKDYPHARKGKKKESETYFKQNDSEEVKKQVGILKRKIRAGLQDGQYIPACERRIRDFTPINDDVVKQDLVRICKRHLNAGGDMKERSMELKQTFGDEEINKIVKAIQQKDSPKNLFLKQN